MNKFENTSLCDYVYIDKLTNKPIIAGVFAGDITITSVPAILRVSVYTELFCQTAGAHTAEITIYVGGKQAGALKIEFATTDNRSPAVIASPFPIDVLIPSDKIPIEIKAIVDNGSPVRILRKLVRVTSQLLPAHRFWAAFLAICARRSGVMLSARFVPPLRLSSAAAASRARRASKGTRRQCSKSAKFAATMARCDASRWRRARCVPQHDLPVACRQREGLSQVLNLPVRPCKIKHFDTGRRETGKE